MNTPITDAVAEKAFHEDGADDYEGYVAMLLHARRLELDRAALMEALERIAGICEIKRDKWIAKFIEEALAAARANFP